MASDMLEQLREERNSMTHELKGRLDAARSEGRALNSEDNARIDSVNDALTTLDERIKKVAESEARSAEADETYNEIEKRRGGGSGDMTSAPNGWIVAPALQEWTEVRDGSASVEVRRAGGKRPLDFRTLVTSGSSSATIPVDFYDQLISYLVEVSGILQTGPSVLNTTGGETLQIPTVTAHPTAASAAQANTLPTSDPTFGLKVLNAAKFATSLYVARELLDDTAIDLLGYLAMAMGRALGNKFGSALLNGTDGVTGGLISSSTVAVTGGLSSAFATGTGQVAGGPSYSNLIDVEYSVIAPYRKSRSCYWLANDQSLGQLRKLSDTTGRPVWEPSVVAGVPDMLLGKPLISDPFMPLFGAGNKSIVFGDFSQYFVRLVGGLRFERSDDFTFDTDRVAFRAILRGDGNLADANALKVFQGGAS